MSTSTSERPSGRLGIGEVLRRLRPDFPDVSISKIRFLEAEGLVAPSRTASGYRKFSFADLEQLRYVLSAQRDHYLPLRVIRSHLDAMSRGLEPPSVAGSAPRAPRVDSAPDRDASAPSPRALRLSRDELLSNSGLTDEQLGQLHDYGLVRPQPGTDHYGSGALSVATAVASLSKHGLEPRHLRAFKTAAEREVSLIDQVVGPAVRSRNGDAEVRAEELRSELGSLAVQLHAALVRQALASPR
ncbi:MAG: transcriptional regulator FtsR [Nocardioidaceae bacterium]